MPWCDTCNRYSSTNALDDDGTCPTCDSGVVLATERKPRSIPWHFWLLLASATIYLGWRAIEGVVWLVGSVT